MRRRTIAFALATALASGWAPAAIAQEPPVNANVETANRPNFIPPIETMADVKGDIVYADRQASFFLLIEGGVFYIGQPAGDSGRDVDYSWGRVADCSSSERTCVQLGGLTFILPNGDQAAASTVDNILVSVWPRDGGQWFGTGIRCAYSPPKAGPCRPITTYHYDVDSTGTVYRFAVTYFMSDGTEETYHLELETGAGVSP